MKLNIQKFQAGGTGLGSLFSAVQVGAPNTSEVQQSTSSPSSSSDPILSKETLNKLRSLEYGLPNELDQFEVELATLEQKLNSGRRVSPREIANIRAKAGRIIAQAGHLKRAEQSAEKNGYLDDIAVDAKGIGYIYALTDKGIEKVSFTRYNPEKHQALTYGDLVEYRRQSPQLINDADIISAINKGTGVEQANDYIMKILDAVKSTGSKQEAYESLSTIIGRENARRMSTMDHAAIRDIALMADNIGLDTLFKTTRISNDENLQHALSYLVSTLPKSMQAQLQAHYMVNMGGTYKDSKTHIGELLYSSVLMKRDSGFEMDYQQDLNTVAGTTSGKKAGGSSKSFYENPLESLFSEKLNQKSIDIGDPEADNKYGIRVQGNTYGQLVGLNGNPISDMILYQALNASVSQVMDYSKVYTGERKVSAAELQNYIYTDDPIAVMYMPVTVNGEIDWTGIQGYSKAEKECERQKLTDPETKNRIHAQYGSCFRYNPKTGEQYCVQSVAPYFRTFAYTVDDTFPGTFSENAPIYSRKIDDDSPIHDRIEFIQDTDENKKNTFGSIAGYSGNDDLFKMPIFIKVQDNASTNIRMAVGHGPLQPAQSEEDFVTEQAIENGDKLQTDPSIL